MSKIVLNEQEIQRAVCYYAEHKALQLGDAQALEVTMHWRSRTAEVEVVPFFPPQEPPVPVLEDKVDPREHYHCPRCFTIGHQHRKTCPNRNMGMSNHVPPTITRTSEFVCRHCSSKRIVGVDFVCFVRSGGDMNTPRACEP